MNMMVQRGEFARQAEVARSLGSPFVAAVLEAGERQLGRAPQTAALVETWPANPSAAALAMRFNAALHALARRDASPALSALFRGQHDDYDGAIGNAIAAEDDFVSAWMRDTPQTNEVGRAAAIAAALMVVRKRFGLPFELLEIGSSCGLNLNLAHYAYDLGGVRTGNLKSSIEIAPRWIGPAPEFAPIEVLWGRGTDLNPLRAADETTRDRLLAYVWADQPSRALRLEQALALACKHPPRIDRGPAADWLEKHLAVPSARNVCRVAFHSMVLQYLTEVERSRALAAIAAAGALADESRPFAWISFEWTPARDEVQLRLTTWPGNCATILATCHAYGDWIDWRGPSAKAGGK